ncbi:MAG: transposase [Chloroflexi bacterium]|nr:transposase [Chloroflexota bacterium]
MNDGFQRRNRRSIRLRAYDYTAPGAYFVTVCTHQRRCLFGEVVGGEMQLNALGRVAEWYWRRIPQHAIHVKLDAFVIMPNHIHGIIWISVRATHSMECETNSTRFASDRSIDTGGAVSRNASPLRPGPTAGSLGAIVGNFKSITARRINRMRGTPGAPVWQRNYYEHIIRDDRALDAIRRYIVQNPVRWHLDRYNAERVAPDPWAEEIWRMMREPFPGREGEDRG